MVRPASTLYSCTPSATVTIETRTQDRDQPENGLTVVFHWTLSNPRVSATTPISGSMSSDVEKGNYYRGTTASFNGKDSYAGLLTVYAVVGR